MPGPLIHARQRHQVRVEQDGPDVVLLLDGRLIFKAGWRYADQVGRALLARAAAARVQEALRRRPGA
jgi:hypothetical protein